MFAQATSLLADLSDLDKNNTGRQIERTGLTHVAQHNVRRTVVSEAKLHNLALVTDWLLSAGSMLDTKLVSAASSALRNLAALQQFQVRDLHSPHQPHAYLTRWPMLRECCSSE